MKKELEKEDLFNGEDFKDYVSRIKMSDETLEDIFERGMAGYIENGELFSKEVIPLREEINRYCYFCDFNEVMPHLHHIIRKCDGGKDGFTNRIPLCANHHECVHRGISFLIFNPKQGFYYLKNRRTGKILPPTERQKKFKRKAPITSIKYSNNLKIEGDLNSKAKISIIDLKKPWRIAQKKILKEQNNKKNLRGSVE